MAQSVKTSHPIKKKFKRYENKESFPFPKKVLVHAIVSLSCSLQRYLVKLTQCSAQKAISNTNLFLFHLLFYQL